MQLDKAKVVLEKTQHVLDAMGQGLAALTVENDRFSRQKLDTLQPEAFAFARCLSEHTAASATLMYAETLDQPYESSLACVYTAMVARNMLQTIVFREASFGLSTEQLQPLREEEAWIAAQLSTAHMGEVATQLFEKDAYWSGRYGISGDHEEMRMLFSRFADERLAPLAEHIHRDDQIVPEDLLQEYAEMGVFGISIPEDFGGSFLDHLTMCLATEELSRGSLGAGGSMITRPEICAKALLKGGTDAQKNEWLPKLATGQKIVSVAVTEPNAGSDVASLRVSAEKVEGGYKINGEKTWCTLAGRADVFILLARTGAVEDGYKGLTLFLVEKPAKISADDHHQFSYKQPEGGLCEGRAIPTIGYRGMHSFSVTFEDYFVPESNRVGEEGQGFILQMQGFAGGRIQTASRAVGVMEAALRSAVTYTKERKVFDQPLSAYSMTQYKIVQMAAMLMASRQLSYHVAQLMDEGGGEMEASLVKLLSCKDAEWLTREAMQMHGGMGYSEEYSVSRYWIDARVLSIFEGAEEVLALYVVARQALKGYLKSGGRDAK